MVILSKGDIEVSNNVYESMGSVAGQNVIVGGNVEFASIFVVTIS